MVVACVGLLKRLFLLSARQSVSQNAGRIWRGRLEPPEICTCEPNRTPWAAFVWETPHLHTSQSTITTIFPSTWRALIDSKIYLGRQVGHSQFQSCAKNITSQFRPPARPPLCFHFSHTSGSIRPKYPEPTFPPHLSPRFRW